MHSAGGEPFYTCPFCKHTSRQEAQLAPAAPQFVIVQAAPDAAPSRHSFSPQAPRGGAGHPVLASLLPLVIISGVIVAAFHTQLQQLTGIGAWDGEAPLVCDGNDRIDVEGVTAQFAQGSAVVARGNCHVALKDCSLKAAIAIEASGNAYVTVTNGTVEGKLAAVDASGNATIDLLGNVRTTGPLHRASNAHVTGK